MNDAERMRDIFIEKSGITDNQKYDRAWNTVIGHPDLKRARAVLSIHEMRTLIKTVLDAADDVPNP